jgi:nucleotide-binding universal stress UspA family protein
MCPVDFSEPALKALNMAHDIAVKFDAELNIIHVVADLQVIPIGDASLGGAGVGGAAAFNNADYLEEMEKNATKKMQDIVAGLPREKVKVGFAVEFGYPSDVIVATVKEKKIDLLVMSTHGCSGFKCFLFGSVAEKVIKTTPCPVLVIGPVERT